MVGVHRRAALPWMKLGSAEWELMHIFGGARWLPLAVLGIAAENQTSLGSDISLEPLRHEIYWLKGCRSGWNAHLTQCSEKQMLTAALGSPQRCLVRRVLDTQIHAVA